ncbi:MAG TPA: M56 family metallopeptidase [Actinomycetota bacterium]|nr:M56 family metallopeptidase [Actinomycetota bacterium]
MIDTGPTILALQADSAWFVIVAVSLVTLPAVLLLRRLIDRPGGLASGILLSLPLVLPLVAAVLYGHPVLPEIAVLRPALQAVLENPSKAGHLMFLRAGGRVMIPYALAASTGPWLLLIGGSATVFMLLRRSLGLIVMRRLMRGCVELASKEIDETVGRLCGAAGLKVPRVRLLPEGTTGVFAVACSGGCILLSRDLIEHLKPKELEAALAHEISHLRARDVRLVAIAGWLRDVVAWNPVAHIAFRRLLIDRELEADRQAAALTGDPLAVASSLLKMCELMRCRTRRAPATALGFGPRRGLVARRVHSLLAVADGRSTVAPTGATPYVAAVMLAAVLALQVGMQMTTGDQGRAVALVWGTPRTAGTSVWTPEIDPWDQKRQADRGGKTRKRGEQSSREVHPRLRALKALQASPAVAAKHLFIWAKTVSWVVRREALRSSGLTSQSSWEVRPLLGQPPVGSLNVYSVERLSVPMRAFRP